MLQCYNRGCGKKYNEEENTDESCCHHPGEPFFHDAYKGWTCCSKKTVDFTEFLNIKGCTLSKHSNIKPPEPVKEEKEQIDIIEEAPIIERKPIKQSMQRPPFESPLTKIQPTVLPAIKDAIDALLPKLKHNSIDIKSKNIVEEGTACKHGGCTVTYSKETNDSECQYHPGSPIFHEGLKYWSCCQKKTSDFTAFMNQKGCTYGNHKWINDEDDSKTVSCRYDWHQTGSNVIVAIYAKMYHYENSSIEVNPIRLKVNLLFPEQNNAQFDLDLELRGIINVEKTTAKMYGTKIEIVMPKAEPSNWANLNFPREKNDVKLNDTSDNNTKVKNEDDSENSDVDLDDLDLVRMGPKIENIS